MTYQYICTFNDVIDHCYTIGYSPSEAFKKLTELSYENILPEECKFYCVEEIKVKSELLLTIVYDND